MTLEEIVQEIDDLELDIADLEDELGMYDAESQDYQDIIDDIQDSEKYLAHLENKLAYMEAHGLETIDIKRLL